MLRKFQPKFQHYVENIEALAKKMVFLQKTCNDITKNKQISPNLNLILCNYNFALTLQILIKEVQHQTKFIVFVNPALYFAKK